MGIRVVLYHRTIYNYDRLVTLSPQIVRLRPAPHSRTPVTGYSLRIAPKDHFINWQQDPYGNFLARLVFPKQGDDLTNVSRKASRLFLREDRGICSNTACEPSLDRFLDCVLRKSRDWFAEPATHAARTAGQWLTIHRLIRHQRR